MTDTYARSLFLVKYDRISIGEYCMAKTENISMADVCAIVNDYRGMCFWNMADDFKPQNASHLKLVAERLENYGDMVAYRFAGRIREWLSQNFNPPY